MRPVRLALLVAGLALCGAAAAQGGPLPAPLPGPHDALLSAGPQAAHIGRLWNLLLGICVAVGLAVLATFAWAVWRSGRGDATTPPDLSGMVRHERGPFRSIAVALGVSTVLLFVLVVASVWTDRALARLSLADAVQLQVTGHQWWWEAQYGGDPASDQFTTANELHVPVGRPVVVTLRSDDVIHSLWVPNLAGKQDLIPGRTAVMKFRADHAGVYRGQCAEFCGLQHAFMAFQVIAEPPARYQAWLAAQRAEASEPVEAQLRRGREVFLGAECVMCHAVRGTTAGGRKGPDLTHVGSRLTLAAGTLANDAEAMKRWIRDPQQIKPGTNMPASSLAEADLTALVAWLGSLK
jgi:cytochrome c oxidase subunit 2